MGAGPRCWSTGHLNRLRCGSVSGGGHRKHSSGAQCPGSGIQALTSKVLKCVVEMQYLGRDIHWISQSIGGNTVTSSNPLPSRLKRCC
jgi:hypothetical protein